MAQIADTTKSNTAIVLIPGSFSPPEFYLPTSDILNANGYTSIHPCPLLSACYPSDQRKPPGKLEDDAFYIREVLHALLEKGKDIIIVMNSYGGFPATQALQGLSSRGTLASQPGAGRQGAIVGLIYLSSFLPLPGDSLRNVMGEYLFEPLKTGSPGQYMVLPEQSGPGIFNEWATEGESRTDDITYWFNKMTTHSSDSFDGTVTHDLWADGSFHGKIVYMIGELDVVVPPALAESMLVKVAGVAGEDKVAVRRFETGGHVMHVTRPEFVVGVIEEVLGGLQG